MAIRADRLALLLVSSMLALGGCASRIQRADSAPPSPDPLLVYETEVTTGDCVYGSGNESALAGLIAGNVISAGVNYFGKALDEAAKETNDHVVANRNVEVTAKTFGPCLQIVRGWFHRGFFSAEESTRTFTDATRTWVVADSSGPVTVDLLAKFWQRRMWLAAQPDFIFEARVVQTNATSPADATLLTLVPVFARLDVPISAAVLRPSKDRDVAVFFAFHKASEDPSAPGTANGGLSLGRLKPGVGLKFPPPISGTTNTPNRSSGESKWFTVALDTTTKPMTISALVSEHQDASAFLQFVSDVFTASKPAITTAIQTAAIPSMGAAAEETDRGKAESAPRLMRMPSSRRLTVPRLAPRI